MPPVIPVATYRLQLSAKFGFVAAAELVPYLAELGVSHLYASPFLKARAGSTHGYDIVDHNELNPEFGGDAGFAHLSQALAAANMGLILDFVPNRTFAALAFSSADLEKGETYDVYVDGTATGTLTDGLYQGGTYTPGTYLGDFTVSGN